MSAAALRATLQPRGKHTGPSAFGDVRGSAPHLAAVPRDADVIVAHGPAAGLADGGMGCEALRKAVARVRPRAYPALRRRVMRKLPKKQ